MSNSDKELRTQFGKENKIPMKYYRQRKSIPVDFSQIDDFVVNYPTKLTAKDLQKVKDYTTQDNTLINEVDLKDTVKSIKRRLVLLDRLIFVLMLKEYTQVSIAKRLKISLKTVKRHVKKIRLIARKYIKI